MRSKNHLIIFRWPGFKWPGLLLVLAFTVIPATSWAALPAFMTITGETQGKIDGGVTQAGREGSIEVWGVSHEVISPYDAATGLPSGKRQHRPIRVVKGVDKATPALYTALFKNENLTEFAIRFWRPDRSGQELQYYTIELVNARVVGIMPSHSSDIPDSLDPDPDEMSEIVSFTYQTMVITWEDGGLTADDTWETPAVP